LQWVRIIELIVNRTMQTILFVRAGLIIGFDLNN
jgi:hypothetical protein